MEKVRWGILSTARIGREKVIPATRQAGNCEVLAISSRDTDRARKVAEALDIPRVHDSYEALLADPDVDAVYIPLPNHLHVPWSIKALSAGKHVLCEKPIGLSGAEGGQLLEAARQHPGLKIMEAFMYRHHPQWLKARALVRDGAIGELRTVHSFFSYFNEDPANIRNVPEMGGGAMMDIGCYCVSLARFLFAAEPEAVLGRVERDPRFGTDRLSSGILEFGKGSATFTCSTQLASYQRVQILGSRGRIEIEIPFNAPPGRACRIWHQHRGGVEEIPVEPCDQYTIQAELFARAVIDDSPVPTPLADGIANLRVIEAIFSSADSGVWTKPL